MSAGPLTTQRYINMAGHLQSAVEVLRVAEKLKLAVAT
jgi:hypothetical protein